MSAQQSPSSDLAPTEWYYVKGSEAAGPFKFNDLPGLIRDGEINRQTLVCRTGDADWTAAGEHANVISLFANQGVPMAVPEEPSRRLQLQNRPPSEPKVDSFTVDHSDSFQEPASIDAADVMRMASGDEHYIEETDTEEEVSGSWIAGLIANPELSISLLLLLVIPVVMLGFDFSAWGALFLWGLLISLVGGLFYRVIMFKESFLWGIAGMFLPVVDIMFAIQNFNLIKRSLTMIVLGAGIALGAAAKFNDEYLSDDAYYDEDFAAWIAPDTTQQWVQEINLELPERVEADMTLLRSKAVSDREIAITLLVDNPTSGHDYAYDRIGSMMTVLKNEFESDLYFENLKKKGATIRIVPISESGAPLHHNWR